MPLKSQSVPVAARLKGKYTINPVTGCHIWNAARGSQAKYPVISSEGNGKKPQYVHHLTWIAKNGSIPTSPCPDGSHRWELHHACPSGRSCICPDHILLVTHREHMRLHKTTRALDRAANNIITTYQDHYYA